MSDAASRSAQLTSVLGEWVARGSIVGGVVLLSEHGRVTGVATSGWADREAGCPMSRNTVLRYASMTKLIVSVAALHLCEQNVLDLDAPITEWLPDFLPLTEDGLQPDILLRHLLSHTSGLSYGFEQDPGNSYEQAGISDGLDCAGIDVRDNLHRLARLPLFFLPGQRWQYSLSTDVLGAVIERACAQSLSQVVTRAVLRPLGMDACGFCVSTTQPLAPAYWNFGDETRRIDGCGWYPIDGGRCRISEDRMQPGAGYDCAGAGMIGTADGYMRLLHCLRAGGAPILSCAAARSLVSGAIGNVSIESRGPGWTFGLGVMILSDPQAAGLKQGGGTWGWCGIHGGHYWVDPEKDLALVALTNTGVTGAWGSFADRLVEVIYA